MERKFVDYNGCRVIEGWPEKIEAAQLERIYMIGGKECPRVPYGSEKHDWHAEDRPCGDCAVLKDQLHVPSCDIEECPCCGEQVLSCDCDYGNGEGHEDAA